MGVMFSTFLSGPVAMLATLGALVAGFFHDFMFRLATGQTLGGGPFESIGRILSQQNMTSEAEPGLATTVEQTLDAVAKFGLWLLARGPARLQPLQLRRVCGQRLQHPRRHGDDLRLPHVRLRPAGVRGGLSVPEEPGDRAMSSAQAVHPEDHLSGVHRGAAVSAVLVEPAGHQRRERGAAVARRRARPAPRRVPSQPGPARPDRSHQRHASSSPRWGCGAWRPTSSGRKPTTTR